MNGNITVQLKALVSGAAKNFERVVSMNYCLKFRRIISDDESFIDYIFKDLDCEQADALVQYIISEYSNLDYMEITIS